MFHNLRVAQGRQAELLEEVVLGKLGQLLAHRHVAACLGACLVVGIQLDLSFVDVVDEVEDVGLFHLLAHLARVGRWLQVLLQRQLDAHKLKGVTGRAVQQEVPRGTREFGETPTPTSNTHSVTLTAPRFFMNRSSLWRAALSNLACALRAFFSASAASLRASSSASAASLAASRSSADTSPPARLHSNQRGVDDGVTPTSKVSSSAHSEASTNTPVVVMKGALQQPAHCALWGQVDELRNDGFLLGRHCERQRAIYLAHDAMLERQSGRILREHTMRSNQVR